MDFRTVAISAAAAWIAGVALSWTLTVLRSQRVDIGLTVLALLAYRFADGSDVIRVAIFVATLVLLTTRPRFEELDRAYGDAARSLGAGEWRLAARLLPLARERILLTLAFGFLLAWMAS